MYWSVSTIHLLTMPGDQHHAELFPEISNSRPAGPEKPTWNAKANFRRDWYWDWLPSSRTTKEAYPRRRHRNHSERCSRNHATAERPVGNGDTRKSGRRRIGSQRPYLGGTRRLEYRSRIDRHDYLLLKIHPRKRHAGNSKRYSLIPMILNKQTVQKEFLYGLLYLYHI